MDTTANPNDIHMLLIIKRFMLWIGMLPLDTMQNDDSSFQSSKGQRSLQEQDFPPKKEYS